VGAGSRWAARAEWARRGKGRGPVLGWETKLGRKQAEREWVLISILFIYLFIYFLFLSFLFLFSPI
jgi:hypothetical protein